MIYAIGDIHGKRRMLAEALIYLRANSQAGDQIVFLGDYVDRGEDSRGVVEDLMGFQHEYPETIFLRGNHEQMMLDTLASRPSVLWRENGGQETLASYGVKTLAEFEQRLPPEHRDFFRATLREWRAVNHFFVHAGFLPSDCPPAVLLRMKLYEWDPRLWVREEFICSEEDFGAIVVFGHTPQPRGEPLVMHNKVGLDTGACFGGRLTVARFDDHRDYRLGPEFSALQIEEAR